MAVAVCASLHGLERKDFPHDPGIGIDRARERSDLAVNEILHRRDELVRRRDLQEAKEKGDAEKIAKREKKLKEAQDDLKALEARDY